MELLKDYDYSILYLPLLAAAGPEEGFAGMPEVLQLPPLVAGEATGMEQHNHCKKTQKTKRLHF